MSAPFRTSPSSARERASDASVQRGRRVLATLFGAPRERWFDIRYWNGDVDEGRETRFTLRIERPGALRRMLLPPSELSIVEAFLSGDVDVDGDLEQASTLGDSINAQLRSPRRLARLLADLLLLPRSIGVPAVRAARAAHTVARAGSRHEPSRDRAAIQYHYDVGNDFYALWLDERMVYSCAYFGSAHDSLDEAQGAKLDLVCQKLRLRPGERLLDVGCGWGALIMHAAKHFGVSAVGVTLSDQQAALARARIEAAGLAGRCRVDLRDYRELAADQRFDKIASVGMVEHVGEPHLSKYFAALHRVLAPGGLLLNHGIVGTNRARPRRWRDWLEARLWRRDAFIDQYVFPDGKLGRLSAVIAAAEGAGFETRDVESLREHYALTLRAWRSRLERNSERAREIAGERVYRTWRLYMAASAHAFASASINVVQTVLAKPDGAGRTPLPLTRADLLAGGRGA